MDNSNLTRLQRVGDRSILRDRCWKRIVGKYTRAAEYLIAINQDIIDRLLDVISRCSSASSAKAEENVVVQPHGQSLPIAAHHLDGSFAAAFRRNLVGLRTATRTRWLHRLLVGPDSRRIMIPAVPRRIAPRHRR